MKFFTIPLFLLLLTVQLLAADRWGSFSDPFPIRDAIPLGTDAVLLATDGGIRIRTLDYEVLFHSEKGLETSSFYALASSDQGVFAVSEFGLVAQLILGTYNWRVLNRSYVNNGSYVVPGEVGIGGHVLVIPFEDRLSFFDVSSGNSILTVRRLGSRDLSSSPIRKLVVREDSLYVKTEHAIFARQMSWDSLSSDVRLSDPNSWKQLSADARVKGLEDDDRSKVLVDGKVLKDSSLYDSDTSLIKWVIEWSNGYCLVGSSLIAYKPKNSEELKNLTESNSFLVGSSYEIVNTPEGRVVVASEDGALSMGDMNGMNPPFYAYNALGSYQSAYDGRMKVLSFLPDGHMFFHIWGIIYQIYSQSGTYLEYSFSPSDTECLDTIVSNYSVSTVVTPAPDNSGFLTATASRDGYSLVYFTKDGEVHCASHVGSRPVAGAIHALLGENGSWKIYVSSKNGTFYISDGSLEVFEFPAPKTNGGELAGGERRSYNISGPTILDMAYDSVGGRLWMVSSSNLYYFDEENDTLMTPSSMNGLRSADYTSISTDVHGNLWVGSTNQGVYRLSIKGRSPDTLSVERYTSKDGLLSNNVVDLTIDPVYGVAWFAHLNGVTYYQRNDLKDARKNMTDSSKVEFKAYPVPFRPKVHARFTIEGITESSVVSIYNRGGALIKSFRNKDVLGGKLEWNGCDKTGRLVAPGVYYYVVNDGSKNKKGKFIIIH